MARHIIRPVMSKTRKVNEFYANSVATIGCPHCRSSLDKRSHGAHGGLVHICNNASCPARTVHGAYYYISPTNERIFPLRVS